MATSVGPDGIDVSGLGWTSQSTLFQSNMSLESSAGPNSSLLNEAQQWGFLAWSTPVTDAQSSFTIGTTLTNYLARIYVPANGSTTKAFCFPQTNVANISAFYMGLYSAAGAKLAATAESHTAIGTSGNNALYTPSWAAATTVTGGQFYYVAMIVGWATGAPTFACSTPSSNANLLNANLTAATAVAASNGTAATPPASYTMSSNSTLASVLWVGIL